MRRILTGRNRLLAGPILVAALLWLGAPSSAIANPPPQPFLNGFEADTSDWIDSGGSTVTRVPSGSSPGAGAYADGIASAGGGFHGRLSLGFQNPCPSGGGLQPLRSGPFTRWGGYSSIFPPGGYRTAIAVYLDVPYALAHPDTRFDWSSAISNTAGAHQRDFAFNAGTDANGFVISASDRLTRCGVSPYDPSRGPVAVSQSGWYVFRHSFRDAGGQLAVDMTLIRCGAVCPGADEAGGTIVGSWTVSNPGDAISNIGGNRYGFFATNEFDQLAIDSGERTGITGGLSVADLAVAESGDARLTVGLSAPAVGNEKVEFSTTAGTAGSPQDYAASTGTLSFDPGSIEEAIDVPIAGDALDEADETFAVQLSTPRNATVSDGEALVTIRDDDVAAVDPPAPDPPVADPPPTIDQFRVVPSSFRPGPGSTPVRAQGAKAEITLSEAADVFFRVRRDPPRPAGGAPPQHRRTFQRSLPQGLSSIAFTGRFEDWKLKSGRYQLIALATDSAGQQSDRARAKFRIETRRP